MTLPEFSPPLSESTRNQLALRARSGCLDSRNQLVESALKLVVKIAHETAPPSWVEDAIQDGSLGLLAAANRFDPDKGSWSSYASQHIEGAIRYGFRKHNTVRVPRGKEVQVIHGDAPCTHGTETPLWEVIPETADDSPSPLEAVCESEERSLLTNLLSRLKVNERNVVTLHFMGHNGEHSAEELGISRQRVNQILHRALLKLRQLYQMEEFR